MWYRAAPSPLFSALLEAQSALQAGPLQPLAACQTQGQTGSSPFRPQPRSVRSRFGWRSRTPESPMAIPTQVPDRETGRRGDRVTGRQQSKRPLILCRRSLRTSPDFSLCFWESSGRFPRNNARGPIHPRHPAHRQARIMFSSPSDAWATPPSAIADLAAPLAPGRDRSGSVRLRSSSHSAICHPKMSASV